MGRTTFVLGSDTFLDLVSGKWKNAVKILKENKIAVVERDSAHESDFKATTKEYNTH